MYIEKRFIHVVSFEKTNGGTQMFTRIARVVMGVCLFALPGFAGEEAMIYPTLPGTTLRDYSKPGIRVERDSLGNEYAYPILPGSNLRDYSQPGIKVERNATRDDSISRPFSDVGVQNPLEPRSRSGSGSTDEDPSQRPLSEWNGSYGVLPDSNLNLDVRRRSENKFEVHDRETGDFYEVTIRGNRADVYDVNSGQSYSIPLPQNYR